MYKLYRPWYHSLRHVLFIVLLDSLFDFDLNFDLDKIIPHMLKFSVILSLMILILMRQIVIVLSSVFSKALLQVLENQTVAANSRLKRLQQQQQQAQRTLHRSQHNLSVEQSIHKRMLQLASMTNHELSALLQQERRPQRHKRCIMRQ